MSTHHMNTQTLNLSLKKLNLNHHIKQLTFSNNGEIIIVNDKSELWNVTTHKLLAKNISSDYAIQANHQFIAAVDTNGYFFLWSDTQTYTSTIRISQYSHFLFLNDAIIAVQNQNHATYLVRIELINHNLEIVATSPITVLPDARPIEANLSHTDEKGHIIVLSEPDDSTYQHGVIGDTLEAKSLSYLDRYTLKPLTPPLNIDKLVFEGNTVTILKENRPKIITVLSGDGHGARAVKIGLNHNTLQIEAQSNPLPTNRWQDTFTKHDKIYAILMPHLKKELVKYTYTNQQLIPATIAEHVSTHQIHSHETNLVGITPNYIILPQSDYQSIVIMDNNEELTTLPKKLPAVISQIKTDHNTVYLLLNNGELWQLLEE